LKSLTIQHLADRPEFIPVCAAWVYGEWGSQTKTGSLSLSLTRFEERSQKAHVPIALVALIGDKPAGTISIIKSNLKLYPDLSPWVSSLFVHSAYRKQGIANALIGAIEQEAIKLGIKTLYLHTETAENLYKSHGFCSIEPVDTEWGQGVLMNKRLTKDT
jgi:GNAT superfamily N-acetyltransferase